MNNASFILMDIISFILLLSAWIWPTMALSTLPFGVRIPPNRTKEPIIGHVRRDYHIGLIVIALLIAAASWLLDASLLSGTASIFITIALIAFDYYSAHKRIAQAKARDNWYAGLRQAVMIDTEHQNQVIQISFLWIAPSLLLLIATIATTIIHYPALPASIPTHFGLDGQPNQWTDKAIGVWMLPTITILCTALLTALAYWLPRSRQQIDPANPVEDKQRQLTFRQNMSKMLLAVAVVVNLSFLLTTLQITGVLALSANNFSIIASMIMIICILGIVIVPAYIISRQRNEFAAASASKDAHSDFVARDDDRYWLGGMIYNNPDDPAFMVEKRMGLGWTINVGHPAGKVALICTAIIIIVSIALPAIFNH
jgi:uncharacterized membrane protein